MPRAVSTVSRAQGSVAGPGHCTGSWDGPDGQQVPCQGRSGTEKIKVKFLVLPQILSKSLGKSICAPIVLWFWARIWCLDPCTEALHRQRGARGNACLRGGDRKHSWELEAVLMLQQRGS